MDDKNVVKKRVTLAIAFAVFIVVVIAVILLIKPVMSKVQENRTAKVSQETAQEAEEFLKTKYPEVGQRKAGHLPGISASPCLIRYGNCAC